MSYQVLARKWRPKNFREMAGQEHVLKALINALDHNRLHHAYLFTGTRGVGKTTIARILAKCLNCERGISSEPCGSCSSCMEITEGRFVDLIEIDAASHTGVDDVRDLIDNSQYLPSRGRFKVYLIDEVHMLSKNAFNALLKTLEEPPPHVKFLLATTDPQKLPVTILSRCLQFNLKNLSSERIAAHLKFVLQQEMIDFEENALWQLGRAADGSMRDALSLTDQAIGFGNGKIQEQEVRVMLGSIDQQYIVQLLQSLHTQNAKTVLETIAALAEHNPDYSNALNELLSLLHRIAIQQAIPDYHHPDFINDDSIRLLAQQMPAEDIQLFYQLGLHGRRDLSLAPDPRAGFEMTLLRMLAFKPAGIPQLPKTSSASGSANPESTVAGNAAKKLLPASTTPVEVTLQNLSPDNWHLLFQQLNLTGVIHNIAHHCILNSVKDTQGTCELQFTLDETQAALFNHGHQERLGSSLSQKFSYPVNITINLAAVHRETPAAIHLRQQQERQAAAEKLFTNDPQVQALLGHFDGKIISDSIQPVHH